ncbi:hypothetical protein Ddye_023881 [Dipteronia dyeriana]|uniref:Uncharacterized protein n=1 Tax=Dipteronia dyeriana TaxID=168575 RepID=A0AAD9TUE3_9ROSI|nr:hypothetical protein Ddye_023881 [Dipteronia dyeriana]
MCANKDVGGLGFRDISVFNRAILAKQGWRLATNSNSLAAHVLKNCYYPDTSFLNAKVISWGSQTWKKFLWGRGIITAGSRWRIGTGSTISIYGDRWIPRPSTFHVISPRVFRDFMTINSLLLPSGGWKVPLIVSSFLADDDEAILNLPTGSSYSHDSLLWHFEKSGNYSVRSGYKIGMSLDCRASISSSSGLEAWWKFL